MEISTEKVDSCQVTHVLSEFTKFMNKKRCNIEDINAEHLKQIISGQPNAGNFYVSDVKPNDDIKLVISNRYKNLGIVDKNNAGYEKEKIYLKCISSYFKPKYTSLNKNSPCVTTLSAIHYPETKQELVDTCDVCYYSALNSKMDLLAK